MAAPPEGAAAAAAAAESLEAVETPVEWLRTCEFLTHLRLNKRASKRARLVGVGAEGCALKARWTRAGGSP